MKARIAVLFTVALAGCGTTGDYGLYLAAQQVANAQFSAGRKPLVLLEAHDGQQITGLKRLEVHVPESAPVIQQARPSEWAPVAQSALGVIGTGLGIKLGGDAAIGLARTVGGAAGVGYQFVNPTPIVAPAVQVVRPEVVQPAPVQVIRPDVVQIPTQVIDQPVVVPVTAGGL